MVSSKGVPQPTRGRTDHINPHMRRFSWMMMSLTAAMTKRICIVSVAQVK